MNRDLLSLDTNPPFSSRLRALFSACIILGLVTVQVKPAFAAEEFNDVQCQVDFADKDLCNIHFFKSFMSARLIKSGSNIRIPYKLITSWHYSNSSLRKRASLLTTRVEHIHIFTIVYRDQDLGTRQTLTVDFDNIKYVPPFKAILGDYLPDSGSDS